MIRFGSVCSGIEAASVAWHPLGWRAAWLSEIEPFPCAVLRHHYPDVPNHGDMTTLPGRIRAGEVDAPDVFCGGTPCQAFSVAGLRRSLDDARGNLSLTFCEIANAIDDVRRARGEFAAVVVWENVPGVLSTADNAFGCFLAGLAGEDVPLVAPGDRWTDAGSVHGPRRTVAWRLLDAQFFGLAQRRRRVFVVASARDGFDPVPVLFEFDGVRRDSAPSRKAREVAAPVPARSTSGGGLGADPGRDSGVIAGATWWDGGDVAATMTTKSDDQRMPDKNNAQLLIQPIAFHPTQDPIHSDDGSTHAMGTGSAQGCATVAVAMAFDLAQITSAANRTRVGPELPASTLSKDSQMHAVVEAAIAPTLTAANNPSRSPQSSEVTQQVAAVHSATMAVRRLTPRECERLQGFPDDYTAIPWRGKPADQCPDGPRYKALGNSWAVPVVAWIGGRIDAAMATQWGATAGERAEG